MLQALIPTAEEWRVLWLSLRVACWCAALSLVPGTLIGYLLARRNFRGKTLVDAFFHLPLVLPPVATGYVLLMVLGRGSWLGGLLEEHLGIRVAFTSWAAVIASAVIGFPLLVRSVRLSVQLIDRRLEEAATTLGAGPLSVFFTVTLPLALPGILTGLVLTFARSLGEFGATITFAGNTPATRTLPLAVFTEMQGAQGESSAARLVIISVILALTALVVSEMLSRRAAVRLGAS
ncbi:MAG TPA: molybdate ABC transporter permease subunit [Phycisphaeraceae bacterium]|nr:molybdate ABC transporter permease subunit [Phycisphaeraceae bacterium]